MSGLLEGRTVVVFAATGAIGSGVARAATDLGAIVYASGHRAASVEKLAGDLGESVSCEVVDATDPAQVGAYLDRVVESSGALDAVFNGIGGQPHILGYPEPVATMPVSQFMIPLERILASTYITSAAGGLRMRDHGGGSIVTLSSTLTLMAAKHMANLTAACAGIEGLTRSLAGEFGPDGIRVNCVRGSAMPETRTIRETSSAQARIQGQEFDMMVPPLGRPITVADTANTAVFLMSDLAAATTGQVLTICAGQFV